MTLFFKNHEITIYRRRRIGTSDKYSMSATFTALWSDIQPSGLDRTTLNGGRVGASYTAYVDTTYNIKEGDQFVTVDDGKKYSVKGVNKWSGAGLLDHLELDCVAQDG